MVDGEYRELNDRTLLRFAALLGLVVPIGLALVAIGAVMIVGPSD